MDVQITGAKILFNIGGVVITETVVNTWIVMLLLTLFCFIITRNLKVRPTSRRQLIAEFIVKTFNNLVKGNMLPQFSNYAPLVAGVMLMSALCSLSGLTGIYAPTADLSTLIAWAVVVFVLITYNKIKYGGLGGYLKGYLEPIPVMLPINIISEIATPVSMAFRHFGNVASGVVVMTLLNGAMGAFSKMLFGAIPGEVGGLLSQIPLLRVGVPAIFSLYFDVFSGCIQAFLFSMLTMAYVSSAAASE